MGHMTKGDPPRVLIVDDDRALSSMLSELLQTEGFACSVAGDGREALGLARALDPDLVILDVMMPGEDGITTLRSLRQDSDVPVLMLTAMGEDDDRILGLEAGADDYLAKPFVARELVLRIHAILKRTARVHPGSSTDTRPLIAGPLTVEPAKDRARLGDTMLELTGAELRILEALVAQPGAVATREELTQFALGRKLTPYDRALDTHVSHLRRKLRAGATGQRCEIRSVRGTGYKLVID